MKIKKYVINLDRRPDRMDEFKNRYQKNDFERFSAVDGLQKVLNKDLNSFEERIMSLLRRDPKRDAGVFGVWMSHFYLWQELAESERDAYVIFEDDAFFVDDFHEKFNEVLNQVTPEMDIVYFGGRFDKNFVPSDMKTNWEKYKNFYAPIKHKPGIDMDRTFHAYIITKNGAKNLVDRVVSYDDNKILRPIDWYLNDIRKEIVSLDYFPHIAWSPLNYKSDIQNVRPI